MEHSIKSVETLKALVVDDDPLIRLTHSIILSQKGYEVTQAENGAQAVMLTQEKSFDVILIDNNMPIMNGSDAVAEIRARERNVHHTIIIGITGTDDRGRESCIKNGMDLVLDKSVAADNLCVIREVLDMIKHSIKKINIYREKTFKDLATRILAC